MKTILLGLLLASTSLGLNAQVLDIPLNGEWLFIADSADFSTGLPSEAVTVSVPHTYNIMDGLEDYAGKAWYEKRIEVPLDLKGCQLKYVKYGQENTLVVGVNNAYSASNFPYMRSFDWANDGGIYRKVNLHVTGSKSIRYAHFTPQLSPADSIGTCKVSIRLHEPQVKGATFSIKVFDKQTHQPVFQTKTMLRRSRQGTFETTINCGRVLPWHFDHPNLYGFEVSVIEGGTISDTRKGHFGFRNFQIEGAVMASPTTAIIPSPPTMSCAT